MPGIYCFRCDRFSFQQKGVESIVHVVTDDGKDEHCPHHRGIEVGRFPDLLPVTPRA